MRIISAVSIFAAFYLAACSDDGESAKAAVTPAAVTPTPIEAAPAPVPAADAPEPVAKDLPAVDPTAEPVDPDELMKLRPD